MGKKMSKVAFSEAERYIAGGVDSPVRAFKAVSYTHLTLPTICSV